MLDGLNWPAFLLAMAVVELTPGPNMGWLTALSARSGVATGLRAVAGITLGLSLQVLAAATGLSTVFAQSPALYEVLRWSGVAFMLYLAWEAWSDREMTRPSGPNGLEGFRKGLIANLLNPKALVFYIAVVGQFADPARGSLWLQILWLGAIHVVVSVIVHTMIVMLGGRLGASIEAWRLSWPVRAGFAASLVAIAVWIALTTARSGGT